VIRGSDIRLLMVTNERAVGMEPGFREVYSRMAQTGQIASFAAVAPAATSLSEGPEVADEEMYSTLESMRPNVVLVLSPHALGYTARRVSDWLAAAGRPILLYWEGDAWHRWAKPPTVSMRSWLSAADVVFSVAGAPQGALLKRQGARDVRFIPHTYCHVQFAQAELALPVGDVIPYEAVLIGARVAHLGLLSRVPGAAGRASLERRLRRAGRQVAVYGEGWKAASLVPYDRQIEAIRQALISLNWDHFPNHHAYASDRLPISLLAGRAHVTTAHPGLQWLPGPEVGLFLERSVGAVVRRVEHLAAMPREEVLALGEAAHNWVKHRLSDREAGRFMLAAVDSAFLDDIPADPWHRLHQGDLECRPTGRRQFRKTSSVHKEVLSK
jgi:hypothetical protein